MKKVLILTAGFGEGHNTAARNIRDALAAVAPGEVDARVVDVLELAFGWLNGFLRKAYLELINHFPGLWANVYTKIDSVASFENKLWMIAPARNVLERLLIEEAPFAVVSTYPLYNYLIRQIYEGRGAARPFAQLTVITDSITINSIWYRTSSDAFIVANEDTAAVLRERGVEAGKIHVLGFPVALRFAASSAKKSAPGPGGRWKTLYVINSGKRTAPGVVKRLLALPEIDLQVTVGRDEKLRAEVLQAAAECGREVEVFGWTEKLPELMCAAHLMISKAGGATVQESLAARTPLLMTQVVPGQEEGNAQALTDNGCGKMVLDMEKIASEVALAFSDNGALWKQWCDNIERLRFPDASREIAKFVLATRTEAALKVEKI